MAARSMRLMTAVAVATATVVCGLSPVMMRHRERHIHRQQERAAAYGRTQGWTLPADQYYNQTLDHFDVLNQGWWMQRFWVNSAMWQGANSSAPVFFYIEGEGAGSAADAVGGQHVELAQQFNGLVVVLEHRYYGASVPTPDMTVNNMRYLSSHQAIGDIARFVAEYLVPTFNLTADNRIITFGGSYPGALSAWTRLRLPHLVSVAFSTSSPILAQLDFIGYNNVVAASVSNSLVGGSPACLAAITAAFQVIDTQLRGTPQQQAAIAAQMSSCAAPTSIDDVKLIASNLASVVMGIVQYNDDQPGGPDVASICQTMTQPGVTPINAFATIVKQSLGGAPCMDNSYADFVAQVGNTTVNLAAQGVGLRQWTWQTCTQFGYYQTCEAGTQCPFSTLLDLQSQLQLCTDAFDPRITGALNADRVNFSVDYLGGQNIGSSRILFTNGLIDPWHALSILPDQNQNPDNSALVIPDGAHCRQMFPSSPNDPPDVKAARAAAAAILTNWLQ